jgi:hypothetical protein
MLNVASNVMRASYLILTLFLTMTLNGQETKLITEYFYNSDKILKEYYVLSDSQNIKHGEYKLYFNVHGETIDENKCWIRESGYYFHNKKDSIWRYYLHPMKSLNRYQTKPDRIEYYDKGNKVGIWIYYREDGQILERYDVLNQIYLPPKINYFGIRYPALALSKNQPLEGEVKVRVIYNNDCKAIDFILVQSLGDIFDKEVLENVKCAEDLKSKYLVVDGCKIKVDTTYSFIFKYR